MLWALGAGVLVIVAIQMMINESFVKETLHNI